MWAIDEHGSLNAVNDLLRSLGVEWFVPGDFGEVLPKRASIPLPDVNRTVRPEFGTRHMGFYFNAPFIHQRKRGEETERSVRYPIGEGAFRTPYCFGKLHIRQRR